MNILVIAEHDNQELKQATLATIAAGLEIAMLSDTNSYNLDVLACNSIMADKLAELSLVNKIICVNNEDMKQPLAEVFTDLVNNIAKDYQYVLLPATTFGKNLAPRVAAKLDINPLSDVIAVKSLDTFSRPIYAGNAIATYKLSDQIKLLTIRPTSFDIDTAKSQANIKTVTSEIINLDNNAIKNNGLSKFIKYEHSESERPELAAASIVVSGGRGLASKENFELIEQLADSLNAAVGASRAAVDAGYVPNDYQVGQTGKIVAPSLYIAVGISGAIQHIAGMQDSKVIVAINKDEEAPIFKIADYGIVGDLFKILPELTEKIRALKN